MRLDALIFDVDGTLADTEEAHRTAFNLAFEQLGVGWKWSRTDYRRLLSEGARVPGAGPELLRQAAERFGR